ncbi:hypothetical protein FQN51_006789 [Onygenales sp. PD_10]|nr:hypothetical protein FQN51_006789 [Onygenales sp. PD_10]
MTEKPSNDAARQTDMTIDEMMAKFPKANVELAMFNRHYIERTSEPQTWTLWIWSCVSQLEEVRNNLTFPKALDRFWVYDDTTEQNRPFDLVVNYCQGFCSEILPRLVNSGTITQVLFDGLAAKGFQPLV